MTPATYAHAALACDLLAGLCILAAAALHRYGR